MESKGTIDEMDGLKHPITNGRADAASRVGIATLGAAEGVDAGAGRVSESTATVRALPAHILAELERIHHSQQQLDHTEDDEHEGDDDNDDDNDEEGSEEGTELSTSRPVRDAHVVTPPSHSHAQTPPPPFMMPTSLASSASYSFLSTPHSPRLDGADSSALPSPPSSPSESVSSLPSVSSSFFFSSAAASPKILSRAMSEHEHEHEHGPPREHDHDQDHEDHGAMPSAHHAHRRRRTLRPQRSESAFSSLESSPSSMELFIGAAGRGRGGARYSRRGGHESSIGHYADVHATSGLIIPSLMLPPALKRPTPFGQTLGEVRLLVMARQGAAPGGRGFLTTLLLEDNDDIVEVGEWEDPVPVSLMANAEEMDEEMVQLGRAGAKVLQASTDWIEHTDAHGLEKFEPMRNVEVVELPGYDALSDGSALVTNLKNIIHAPFHAVSDVLRPDSQPSAVLANLVGSASTPLFTALILLLPSSLTSLDRHIVDSLGAHIPIIVLPASAASSASASSSYPASSSSSFSSSYPASRNSPAPTSPVPDTTVNRAPAPLVLSSFTPHNAIALKHGLFHSPETLSTLRMEAAGRFLRWREVERVVRGLHGDRGIVPVHRVREASRVRSLSRRGERKGLGWRGWDKEKWEREWMAEFSRDVAVGMKETAVRQIGREEGGVPPPAPASPPRNPSRADAGALGDGERRESERFVGVDEEEWDEKHAAPRIIAYTHSHSFDPLHFPSLFLFTVSMLGPLKTKVVEAVKYVCWVPFEVVFGTRSGPQQSSLSPAAATAAAESDGEISEKQDDVVRVQSQTQKWVAVGGLVGAGFCVGVGVGVVVAGSGAD